MLNLEQLGPELAAFALADGPPSLPPFYTDAFLNWFGCALAGARRAPVERAVAVHKADAVGVRLPPIGRSERLGAAASVAIDCLSSACLAYDDIHFQTTLHPTGPVAAAVLGLSRCQLVSGADALRALRVGMEVECRLALAMMGSGTRAARGWYPTGIAGGLGAAAAVGRLLGLDAKGMETALGLAATRASGTRGTHGAMAAYWVPAVAAESGYIAARMAEAGFTCDIAALTGMNGLIRQIAPRPDLEAALSGLNRRFICEDTACKPYPFGFVAHAVIKACLDLHALRPALNDLVRMALEVSPTAAMLGGNRKPATVFDAQVSLCYIAARVLSDPALAWEPLPEDFAIADGIEQIMKKIVIGQAETLCDDQCRLHAIFNDGSEARIDCDSAPGAPGNLPSPVEVATKFLRLTSAVIGADGSRRMLSRLQGLQEMPDISLLLLPDR